MSHKTIGVEPDTHQRFNQGKFNLASTFAKEVTADEALNWLMDSVGWSKVGKVKR